MEIRKEQKDQMLTLVLSGRLDAVAAPALEKIVREEMEGITSLVFDLRELVYVASAGLRVLLMAQKHMKEQGEMKLIHVNDDVKEILEVTGFCEFLTVED